MRMRGKRLRTAVLLAEDQVHDLGAARERGYDLMPVYQLGRGGLVVPGQLRDRLHRDAMSR